MLVHGMEENVAGAAAFLITPPANQAYLIEYVASDQPQADVGTEQVVADLQIEMTDGAIHATCISCLDPNTVGLRAQKVGRKMAYYIDPLHPLQVRNTAAGAADISWIGHRVNPQMVVTELYTAPNGGKVEVRPPDTGEVWMVTEMGGEVTHAQGWPDVNVMLTDGTLALAMIVDGSHDWGQDPQLNWILTHDLYLEIAPILAADCDVSLSMIKIPVTPFGGIVNIGIAGDEDIRPLAGESAVITTFAAETFANTGAEGLPRGAPDVTVRITDGTLLSNLIEGGSVTATMESAIGQKTKAIEIDHDYYLNAYNDNAAANQFAYAGYFRRGWNP